MKHRLKTSGFYLLTAVLVWSVVELAAVVGHAVLDGRLFSPGAIRDQARAVAERSQNAVAAAGAPSAAGDRAADRLTGRWSEVIHPYFGVVVDPGRHPAGAVSDLGFAEGAMAEALLRPAPDTAVVGVFGGSFAAGVYRQLARLDGPTLARRLGAGEGTATAVSFAKGGYKQPQQLMVLAYLLALGARPDVVINVDGFNEVALPPVENVARGVNPFYPRQWHLKARGVLDPETVRGVGYLRYLEASRSRRAGRLLAYGMYRSPVVSLTWRGFDRRLLGQVRDARQAVDRVDAASTDFKLVRRSWSCLATAGVEDEAVALLRPLRGQSFARREQFHQAVVDRIGIGRAAGHRESIESCAARSSSLYAASGPRYTAGDEELYRDLAGMWQRGSLAMRALCDAHGIRYYHFLQPNQYLEGSKPMTGEERRIAINPGQPYRRGAVDGYPLLRKSGRGLIEDGVAFTDLTMIFDNDRQVRYADDCCHLTKEGYVAVVDRILEAIKADNPGPASARALPR